MSHENYRCIQIPFLTLLIVILMSVSACSDTNEGGSNQNSNNAGNQDDGVELLEGRIAIFPSGDHFLAIGNGALTITAVSAGAADRIDALAHPGRVAFDLVDDRFFVTLGGVNSPFNSGLEIAGTLVAYDLSQAEVIWTEAITTSIEFSVPGRSEIKTTYPLIEMSPDNSILVVANASNIQLRDPATGETLRTSSFGERRIVDIDFTPDFERVLITLSHVFENSLPETRIVAIPLKDVGIAATDIFVPNCSSELLVAPSGEKAFLAPTTCQHDPISVIDLENNDFVRNLPGFGPVSIASSGEEIIGFIDLQNIDAELFDNEAAIPDGERYQMMFVNVSTLTYDFLEVGDQLPRYAPTPDGRLLLVDAAWFFDDGRIRLLDVDTRSISNFSGPGIQLDDYVMLSDSSRAFLLDSGLFDLDIVNAAIFAVQIDFSPTAINLTSKDSHLLLREGAVGSTDALIHIFDIDTGTILRTVDVI